MMMVPDSRRFNHVIGALLAVIALIVYGLTLSGGAYPGESAKLIAENTGLFPRLTPFNPLWGSLVWGVSKLPMGSLALRLNVLSAVCGAGAVWFLYAVAVRLLRMVIQVDVTNKSRAGVAVQLAAISSALFFAFCVPFWVVANRAHNASFDILILLALTWLFCLYAETGKERLLLLFAFAYGISVVEFTTLIVLVPVFGFSVLLLLFRSENLRVDLIVRAILCGLGGMVFYGVAAWQFFGSTGYELMGFTGYFQIVWIMWRDQWLLISRSLPSSGWLVVLVTTVVPWLTSLMVANRALNNEKDWAYHVLHGVMTFIMIGVLLNAKFAPWPMLGFSRLLVTPYLLTAWVCGYLVAYWYLVPTGWWPGEEGRVKALIRKWLGGVIVGPILVLLCVAPLRNMAVADARGADVVSRYANEIISSLSGRSWLITDGAIDHHLRIAARDLGYPLTVLNAYSADDEVYKRYVATLFDVPRLKNASQIGMIPLMEAWFKSDEDVEGKVAVLAMPELWSGLGFAYVPNKMVFFGTRRREELKLEKLMADHEEFWDRIGPFLKENPSDGRPARDFKKHVVRQVGFAANNLGVLMEDLGRRDDAFRIYKITHGIDPENVSALLNLVVMLENGYSDGSAEEIRKELNDRVAKLKAKYRIWALSRYYGYVRVPEAFLQLGWTWALSGQPGMAASGLRKAMDLLPDDRKGFARQTLADLYRLQEEDEESQVLYNEILMEDPDNTGAILGLARIASKQRDVTRAVELLDRAQKAGASADETAIERARMYALNGNAAEARKILQGVVDEKPDRFRVWSVLAGVAAEQNDTSELEECIRRMEKIAGGEAPAVLVARGSLAMLRNDWNQAREHFERLVTKNLGSSGILELLVKLDILQNRAESAGAHVKKLLSLDPGNALGNHVLGSLQYRTGQYALAADSFRKSLERKRSPHALNDLAWLLQEQHGYAEAEGLARESIAANDQMYQSWDTLGVILLKTGRLEESEKAFDRSVALFQQDLEVYLHMAELKVMVGKKEKARELINMLSEERDQLPPRGHAKLDSLRRAIEEK